MRGDAHDVHPSRTDFDEEEHVPRAKPERLDHEEVAGQDALALRLEKLRQRRPRSPRSWAEAVSLEDPPDRLSVDADTELEELALDPEVTRRGFSRVRQRTASRTSGLIAGRPGLRVDPNVHFRRTSSRCHRSSVCGVIRNANPCSRPKHRLAAARSKRSRMRNFGGPAWRRRTRSWWRRTAISTSRPASPDLPASPRSRHSRR
jgi:hypothetical protein